VVKDIVLARSPEEACRTDPVWELPPDAYFTLQAIMRNYAGEFPLLHSMVAYDEGPEGDFLIAPDQCSEFKREIEGLIRPLEDRLDEKVKAMLDRLVQLANEARSAKLTLFGVAD